VRRKPVRAEGAEGAEPAAAAAAAPAEITEAELDEPGADVKAPAPKDAAPLRRRPAAPTGAPRRGGR
jgi:hypothetical protein